MKKNFLKFIFDKKGKSFKLNNFDYFNNLKMFFNRLHTNAFVDKTKNKFNLPTEERFRSKLMRQQSILDNCERFLEVNFGYVVHFPSNENDEILELRTNLTHKFSKVISYKINTTLTNFFYSKKNGPRTETFVGTLLLVGFKDFEFFPVEKFIEAHKVYSYIKQSGNCVEAVKMGQYFITESLYLEFVSLGFDMEYLYKLITKKTVDNILNPVNPYIFSFYYSIFFKSLVQNDSELSNFVLGLQYKFLPVEEVSPSFFAPELDLLELKNEISELIDNKPDNNNMD